MAKVAEPEDCAFTSTVTGPILFVFSIGKSFDSTFGNHSKKLKHKINRAKNTRIQDVDSLYSQNGIKIKSSNRIGNSNQIIRPAISLIILSIFLLLSVIVFGFQGLFVSIKARITTLVKVKK
jgi:hypothetical protein